MARVQIGLILLMLIALSMPFSLAIRKCQEDSGHPTLPPVPSNHGWISSPSMELEANYCIIQCELYRSSIELAQGCDTRCLRHCDSLIGGVMPPIFA
ncbi:hypothetical protein Nepgr_020237 [Nepenthes gracilis]|uniref:Uncharacterized protein n=1 Tax=Nepenthes gracilis TaxID=150966 RepID=A0AAD3SYQ7_NEPGR|nr:hypothetical protein Nepgr_020237 [Nepenthes gracilis]